MLIVLFYLEILTFHFLPLFKFKLNGVSLHWAILHCSQLKLVNKLQVISMSWDFKANGQYLDLAWLIFETSQWSSFTLIADMNLFQLSILSFGEVFYLCQMLFFVIFMFFLRILILNLFLLFSNCGVKIFLLFFLIVHKHGFLAVTKGAFHILAWRLLISLFVCFCTFETD